MSEIASVSFPSASHPGDERKRLFDDVLFFVCSVFRGLKPTAINIEPLRGSSGTLANS